MKLAKHSIAPIDFGGLQIVDYTGERDTSSSLAEITVPSGVEHPKAWSRKYDKYYYVASGNITFHVDDSVHDMRAGDVCIIEKEHRFSYQNRSGAEARLLLIHTPRFDMGAEVFEE